jgi:hypothetical protein
MPSAAASLFQSTTLRVPKRVYELAKDAIRRSQQSSFNEFVVQAIEEKLRRMTEAEIDAAFASMADDADYQGAAVAMAREFETSDWQAMQSEPASEPAISAPSRRKSLNRAKEVHGGTSKTRSR